MILCVYAGALIFRKNILVKQLWASADEKKIVDSKPLLPVIVIVEISTLWMRFHFSVIDALVYKKMIKS